jgi:hypothetical protein
MLGRKPVLTAALASTIPVVDHRSFRDMLLSSIGFTISCNRDQLRRMLERARNRRNPRAACEAGG